MELSTNVNVKNENSEDYDINLESPTFVENCEENSNLLLAREESEILFDHEDLGLNENHANLSKGSNNIAQISTLNEKNQNGREYTEVTNAIPVGYEAVLLELGNPGKFHLIQICLNLLSVYIVTSTVLIYVFIGFEPPHLCKKVENETIFLYQNYLLNSSTYELHYGKCDITVTSNTSGVVETVATFGCLEGHDYKGYKHISFVAEWDLVCDNAGLKELVQTILLVGQTAGGVICTSFADKYGRRPVALLTNFLLGACSMAVAYAPNIYVLIVFRFLCGLLQQGANLVSYTLLIEHVKSQHRQVCAVLRGVNWSFTIIVLALLAYIMRDESWRTFQMVAALFACNVFLGFFVYESPRWLIANKRYDQALAIVKKACRINGKDYDKVKAVFYSNIVHQQDDTDQDKSKVNVTDKKVERYSLLDIVRHKTLLVSALIMFFIWITNSVTYFGLYMTSSNLAGDRHLNFFLMAAASIPADIMNLFLFAHFGRKTVLMGCLLVAGSGLFVATMLRAFGDTMLTSILSTFFSIVGQLGISASFNGIFMYTNELFPTNLRSAGFGVCSSMSRIGGMIAPYSQALAEVVVWGPGLVFSSMCFLSAIMFIKLPETKGRPMPSTISEMKQRSTRQRKMKNSVMNKDNQDIVHPKKPSSDV